MDAAAKHTDSQPIRKTDRERASEREIDTDKIGF